MYILNHKSSSNIFTKQTFLLDFFSLGDFVFDFDKNKKKSCRFLADQKKGSKEKFKSVHLLSTTMTKVRLISGQSGLI